MRYCGHFLIKAEGGAKNYKRDHPFTVSLAIRYRGFRAAKGLLDLVRIVESRYLNDLEKL